MAPVWLHGELLGNHAQIDPLRITTTRRAGEAKDIYFPGSVRPGSSDATRDTWCHFTHANRGLVDRICSLRHLSSI